MLEGLADKQLSAAVEGEVPPQREHERDRQGPAGRATCGLWAVGGRGAAFVQGLKGARRGGGFGGPSLLLTWNRQPEGCLPRGAEGLNLGQEAWGWGQAGSTEGPGPAKRLLAGRQVPHPQFGPQVLPGWGMGWVGVPYSGVLGMLLACGQADVGNER